MIAEKLSGVYASLEDKYYNLLDFLDSKGVPVYAYNDFLEEKGIPAFPFTVAISLLIIIAIIALLSFGTAINPTISFSLENQFNEPIDGVMVTVKDASGRQLETRTVSNGGTLELQGIPIGTKLEFTGEKEGYEPASYTMQVKKEEDNRVVLQLNQIIKSVNAFLTLVDEASGDGIADAHVVVRWRDQTIDAYSDSSGIVSLTAVPEGMQVGVTIETEAYETLTDNYDFLEGENKTISLSPKSISLQGVSKLLISVKNEEGNLLSDVEITIRDKTNDSVLFQDIATEGEYYAEIPKGTSVRLTAQKSGYLRYDSQVAFESRTLRQDEEVWEVFLRKGGEKLTVLTYAEGNMPLGNTEVQLFNSENIMVDSDTTGLGGTVEFTDLNGEIFTVTAWRDGYLPARKQVNVAETETVALVLASADTINSVYLAVYVVDSTLGAANNADLFFWEKQGEQLLPLGIPSRQTDLGGYASVKVPLDITVAVEGKKGLEEGWSEKEIEAGILNEIRIELQKAITVVELVVLDEDGNPVEGTIKISSPNGDLLFEGELLDGVVFFDAQGNDHVNVEATTSDGRTYTEQVNVADKDKATLNLGEERVDSLAPSVSFDGIFNSKDEPVDGIAKGEYYWLRFQMNFPEGTPKGGLHVRVGPDNVAFVDSQEIGVIGFDAVTSDYFFGKSYQPSPSPGNESADKQNMGKAGALNKWLELYFENPSNTVIAKVKVKAETTMLETEFDMHYRAWGLVGSSYFRSPADTDLGEALFSESKTALYAETLSEKIQVFETDATCSQELCTAYRFVDTDGLYIEPDQFKPVSGNTYSLEVDLRSSKQTTATLKLDTSKTRPLLYFTGYDIDSFENLPPVQEIAEPFPADTDLSGQGYLEDLPAAGIDSELETNPYGFDENERTDTTLTVSGINILAGQQRTVRIYFRTAEAGDAFINTQAIAGSVVINKDFWFKISQARELALSVSPAEIQVGEDFTVSVRDKENGAAVGNATLHLKDSKGSIVHSIIGNASNGKGLNGNYLFKNSFDPGFYKIGAMAKDYAIAELEITIAQDKLLEMKAELKIKIEKGQKDGSASTALKNLSEFAVTGISYELIKPDNFPDEFYVTVEVPPSLNARQEGRITVHVEVDVEDMGESLHGELELVVTGSVAGEFPTKTKSSVVIDYNKKLDAGCLDFDKKQLRIKLIGSTGSTASEELELENDCGEELSLKADVESRVKDPNLEVSATPVNIPSGETANVTVTALNKIERMYAVQQPFEFTLTFESNQLSKSIKVFVELWNPRFGLDYPPNLALWLARPPAQNLAKDSKPLFVRNTGRVPITAFRMAIEDETYRKYPQLRVDLLPSSVDHAVINPGQPLSPSRYVHAEFPGETAFTEPVNGFVSFHGVVMGRQYPFGKTAVAVNYGGFNCLKLSAEEAMVFASKATYGVQFKEVTLKNECMEPVRVRTVEPKQVQGNTLSLVPSDFTLQPQQAQKVRLQLAVAKETRSRNVKVKAMGLLVRTQQFIESNTLEITIDIGERATTSEGKATTEKTVKLCGPAGGETKIVFPKLSSDCSQGYCDAKQLAQYLAKELNNLMKRVREKIQRGESNAANFPGCQGKSHCTFLNMGITAQTITVFAQLDFMTPEVMQHEIQNGSFDELKVFPNVAQGEKKFSDIGETGFDYGAIHLGGVFRGCGKYAITMEGAVQVINDEIIIDGQSFVVTINQVKGEEEQEGRVVTPECENKVQNVPNFLPLDEKYTKTENYGSWPGLVWYEDMKLEKAADVFADKLFKAKEPRIVKARQDNSLKLVLGQVEGGLVKVEIEGAGNSDEPKVVIVTIPEIAGTEIEKIAKEAAEAIFALKSGIVKGCIDPSDPPLYFILEEAEFLEPLYGKLEILSKSKSIKINAQEQCIDFNVTRKIEDEVKLRTSFVGLKESKTGIEAVRIYTTKEGNKDKLLREENTNDVVSKNESVKLIKKKRDGGEETRAELYTAELKFCVDGDEYFTRAAENVGTIKIWAKSIKPEMPNPETKEPLEMKVQPCGIHPKELIKRIIEQEKGIEKGATKVFYATISWKGEPEPSKELNLSALRRLYMLEAELAEEGPAVTGEPISGLSSTEGQLREHKIKALTAYFGACAIVAWPTPWGSVIFDCLIPSLWRLGSLFETTAKIQEFVVDVLKNTLGPVAAGLVNGVSGLFGGGDLIDLGAEEEPTMSDEEAEEFFGEMVWKAAGIGTGTKSVLYGIGAAKTKVTLSSVRHMIAPSITGGMGLPEQIADEFITKRIGKLPSSATKELKDALAKEIREELREKLLQTPSITGLTRLKSGMRGQNLDAVVREVLPGVYTNVGDEFDDLAVKYLIGGGTGWSGVAAAELGQAKFDKIFKGIEGKSFGEISDEAYQRLSVDGMESLFGGVDDVGKASTNLVDSITDELWDGFSSETRLKFQAEGIGRTKLKSIVKTTVGKKLTPEDLAEGLKAHGSVLEKADLMKLRGEIVSETGIIRTAPDIKTMHEILDKYPQEVRDRFMNTLNNRVRRITKESLEEFQSRNSHKIFNAVHKKASTHLAAELRDKFAEENLEMLLKNTVKKPGAIARLGRFTVGLLKGVAVGVAANALGMLASNAYWNSAGPNLVETGSEFQAKDLMGVYDDDGKLIGYKEVGKDIGVVKNQSYKITILKTLADKAKTRVEHVQTDDQFEEMAKAIEKDPKADWNDNCTDFWTKKSGMLLCRLGPLPRKDSGGKWLVRQEHAMAYKENCQLIRFWERELAVAEEFIVAVLIEQPDKIKGCDIEEKWWKEDLDEREASIECAAKRLFDFVKNNKSLNTFVELEKGEAVKYVQNIQRHQEEWNKTRLFEISGTE